MDILNTNKRVDASPWFSKDVEGTLDQLFGLQDHLFKAGARNFLLVNIPPLPRQSQPSPVRQTVADRRTQWNELLVQKLATFAETHTGSSTFLFDSHTLFTNILDSPASFGFSADPDVGTIMDNEVWCDHIHPTTATHKIVAREIFKFMTGTEEVKEREPRWAV
ncbi:hypothetical protein FRB96_008627 [Tulasnella sp. 330]|nr:hypothetical protein FRB96_008627 [Tulasnella sp. 330]KAG8871954.1 hypothetical protein FRB97_008173 [Tulasnella sp. 331]